jgi:hypothetical protein
MAEEVRAAEALELSCGGKVRLEMASACTGPITPQPRIPDSRGFMVERSPNDGALSGILRVRLEHSCCECLSDKWP